MKIYLVKRTPEDEDEIGWNEYTAFVCVAESEEEALSINPGGSYDSWPYGNSLSVTDMGFAHDDQKKGIVLSSYTGA